MMNFLKEIFSKENIRHIGVVNYLAASGGSKDAIKLYNDCELNKEKVS